MLFFVDHHDRAHAFPGHEPGSFFKGRIRKTNHGFSGVLDGLHLRELPFSEYFIPTEKYRSIPCFQHFLSLHSRCKTGSEEVSYFGILFHDFPDIISFHQIDDGFFLSSACSEVGQSGNDRPDPENISFTAHIEEDRISPLRQFQLYGSFPDDVKIFSGLLPLCK